MELKYRRHRVLELLARTRVEHRIPVKRQEATVAHKSKMMKKLKTVVAGVAMLNDLNDC